MTVALTVSGVVLLLLGLYDMFHTLLWPTGQGWLSSAVLAGSWRVSRAGGHRAGSAVGPAAMVAVILLWVALQTLGWALIYLPHVPDGFAYSAGIDPARYPDLAEAIYLSAVTLATLGFGDMVATHPGVRAVSPLQALTGFALLTAALTWFTQIYPPLSRRRALALGLKGLADSSYAETLQGVDPSIVTRVLDALAAQVTTVRIDFAHHSEGFYFQEQDPALSLARQGSYLLALRSAALGAPDAAVRSSGERLSVAIDQLSGVLDRSFLHVGPDPAQVFTAYATQHGHDPGPA